MRAEPKKRDGSRVDDTGAGEIWRRVHRPEDYLADISREVARQWGVPYPLFVPFLPPMRSLLKTWEPAAIETTQYIAREDGTRLMRTLFDITNYSNHRIYGLAETAQRFFSRNGARVKREGFEWELLGGILNEYAGKAHLRKETTEKLLEFRLRNSDYYTMTLWSTDTVEIANLKTGRVESLELPPGEIAKVVDWSVDFQQRFHRRKKCEMAPGCQEIALFEKAMEKYREIKAGKD